MSWLCKIFGHHWIYPNGRGVGCHGILKYHACCSRCDKTETHVWNIHHGVIFKEQS